MAVMRVAGMGVRQQRERIVSVVSGDDNVVPRIARKFHRLIRHQVELLPHGVTELSVHHQSKTTTRGHKRKG
jgi:hypothetical protein